VALANSVSFSRERSAALRGARRFAVAAALAAFGYSFGADASEGYPKTIDTELGVACPNPLIRCLICHDTAAGGEETANQPLAVRLKDLGLEGEAPRSLLRALDALPPTEDNDGDGTPSLEELSLCMNPSGGELSEGPGYGCNGAHVALAPPARSSAWLWALGLVPVLTLLRAARRRQTRPAQANGETPLRG
jgi:hypothetical protein